MSRDPMQQWCSRPDKRVMPADRPVIDALRDRMAADVLMGPEWPAPIADRTCLTCRFMVPYGSVGVNICGYPSQSHPLYRHPVGETSPDFGCTFHQPKT